MSERGILFSAPMVRALLAGTKTQTRRAVKVQEGIVHAADNPDVRVGKGRSVTPGWHTRPALFMPRAASRILLEVVSVRVERLLVISEHDATAEGIECGVGNPIDSYRSLWEQINGTGSWSANPWIWVVEFRRREA